QGVLVDRQRAMKNIALNGTAILKFNTAGADGALDAATDCDVLRNHGSFNLRAIADHKIRSAYLAFDAAEDLRWTIGFYFTNDRHAGADARGRARFRPFRPQRDCFSDRTLRLQEFEVICDRAPILLGCLVLEIVQHAHLHLLPYRLRYGPQIFSASAKRQQWIVMWLTFVCR